MENKTEHITTPPPTTEQLKHREQLKHYRNLTRQRELRNARNFKLGEMLSTCWPCVELLQVHRTKAENEAEFALLQEFLLQIGASEQYTTFRDSVANRAGISERQHA